MAFEPFGYGDRWYDRLGGGKLKPKERAIVFAVIVVLAIVWQVS